ncbi:hypothetical protein Tco_0148173, partial [Tanacetum coccineum]
MSAATSAATWQQWPPFDPTVDWRSTAIDRWYEVSRRLRGMLSLVDPAVKSWRT